MPDSLARPKLSIQLAQQLHQIDHQHYKRIVIFILLYISCGAITFLTMGYLGNPWWGFLLFFPVYILAGASLHGISLFVHEGVHSTLSTNPLWNRCLSILCALPVWQNFSAYKVLHLKHHRHLGEEGDPDHYPNYTQWTWLEFAMYWGRLILGYPAYITAIPLLGFIQGNFRDRLWIILEVMLLITLIVLVWHSNIPTMLLVHGWLMPMVVINTIVNIRGMSQHTLLEHEKDEIRGTRTIVTNPITTFFMCNENFHLEHHLYPNIPWYNLPQVHQEMKEDLRKHGAPFISSYWEFVRDFIIASWQRSPAGSVSYHD